MEREISDPHGSPSGSAVSHLSESAASCGDCAPAFPLSPVTPSPILDPSDLESPNTPDFYEDDESFTNQNENRVSEVRVSMKNEVRASVIRIVVPHPERKASTANPRFRVEREEAECRKVIEVMDVAVHEVFRLLSTDIFPRFIKTDAFRNLSDTMDEVCT